MIEVFKITHNLYDPEVSPELRYYPKSNTRGNKYKLLNNTFHYDTRKYSCNVYSCVYTQKFTTKSFILEYHNRSYITPDDCTCGVSLSFPLWMYLHVATVH